MPSSKVKRIIIAVAGAAVGLAVIAAVIALVQGPASSRTSYALQLRSGSAGMMPATAGRAKLGMAAGAPSMAEESASADAYAPQPVMIPYPSGGQTAAEVDQKIIKNGTLRITVDRVAESIGRIASIATARGGFVQESSSSERVDGTHEGQVTIRVPAKDFEMVMADVKALAKVVNYEVASGQDVTEQYTDLTAQLRNARAQEEEYLRIMKKADTVEDILKVQERLGQVRGQIESLQGRLKYLENVTSYSTVSVSLAEEPRIQVPTKEFRPGSIASEAVQALVGIAQRTAAAAIWIAIVGGGIGVPAVAIVLVAIAIVRRRRIPKA
ncbi:MAG: hypothetical protein RL272_998 [Candidatus Parcubacteria bacterium]